MNVTYNGRPLSLGQLSEYMGTEATEEDAEKMRVALLAAGIDDIAGIDEAVWLRIMHDALAT